MFILRVHIAGWVLIIAFILTFILRRKLTKNIIESFTVPNLKLFLKNLSIAILTVLALLFFCFKGRNLSFSTPPKLYKDLLSYIDSEKIEMNEELKRSIGFCGTGNIYKCLCELDILIRKHPEESLKLLKLRKAINLGVYDQIKSEKYLK